MASLVQLILVDLFIIFKCEGNETFSVPVELEWDKIKVN